MDFVGTTKQNPKVMGHKQKDNREIGGEDFPFGRFQQHLGYLAKKKRNIFI